MAIRIDVPEAEWVEYTPACLDNRDSDDPMTCEIMPMSISELRQWQSHYAPKLQGKGADRRAVKITEEVLTERVRNVQGLYVQRPIETGADLAQHGLTEVINDVFDAVLNLSKLSEGMKKK